MMNFLVSILFGVLKGILVHVIVKGIIALFKRVSKLIRKRFKN